MLKIRIVTIGKDKDRWITDGVNHYLKLLSKYAATEIILLPDVSGASSLPPEELKKRQAERFEPKLGKGLLVALSEKGRQYDSVSFSKLLEKIQVTSGGAVTMLIGGAFGLHESLISKADHVVSLSGMTFSHQLCRLILLEQLYRGMSILHGTSYHK